MFFHLPAIVITVTENHVFMFVQQQPASERRNASPRGMDVSSLQCSKKGESLARAALPLKCRETYA